MALSWPLSFLTFFQKNVMLSMTNKIRTHTDTEPGTTQLLHMNLKADAIKRGTG